MKSMEIGSKQKYAHKQFLRGCFSVYHFEVPILSVLMLLVFQFCKQCQIQIFLPRHSKSYDSAYIFFLFFEKEIQ